jgi:hypothetical protein
MRVHIVTHETNGSRYGEPDKDIVAVYADYHEARAEAIRLKRDAAARGVAVCWDIHVPAPNDVDDLDHWDEDWDVSSHDVIDGHTRMEGAR